MYKARLLLFLPIFLLVFPSNTFAESTYVLPYPSYMPGNKFYKISQLEEKILKYWYFGNLGQFKYNLKYADKYLVEAKTLYEYKQYIWAEKAINKSDEYFQATIDSYKKIKQSDVKIRTIDQLFYEAATKHIDVLKQIDENTPDTFPWFVTEKITLNLPIKNEIDQAILLRSKAL